MAISIGIGGHVSLPLWALVLPMSIAIYGPWALPVWPLIIASMAIIIPLVFASNGH